MVSLANREFDRLTVEPTCCHGTDESAVAFLMFSGLKHFQQVVLLCGSSVSEIVSWRFSVDRLLFLLWLLFLWLQTKQKKSFFIVKLRLISFKLDVDTRVATNTE